MKARAARAPGTPDHHRLLTLAEDSDRLLPTHAQYLAATFSDLYEKLSSSLTADPTSPPITLPELHSVGEPNLGYTLFVPEAGNAQFLRLVFDTRLPLSSSPTWEDLTLISEHPTYGILSPLGFGFLHPTPPEWETKRLTWALHSLCQATLHRCNFHHR